MLVLFLVQGRKDDEGRLLAYYTGALPHDCHSVISSQHCLKFQSHATGSGKLVSMWCLKCRRCKERTKTAGGCAAAGATSIGAVCAARTMPALLLTSCSSATALPKGRGDTHSVHAHSPLFLHPVRHRRRAAVHGCIVPCLPAAVQSSKGCEVSPFAAAAGPVAAAPGTA